MGVLDIVKGFFIAILGLLLTSAIVMAILTNSAKSTFLEPAFYATQLEKADAYALMKEGAVSMIIDSALQEQLAHLPPQMQEQIKVDAKQELSVAIPTSWLKTKMNGLINSMLRYVKGETATLDASISITEIKPAVATAMTNIITRQQMMTVMEKERLINVIIAAIPNTVDLDDMSKGELKKFLDELKEPVRQLYAAADVLIWGSAVIAVLIVLLAFSIKGALRHVGWPMFLGGALTLAMAFVLPAAMEQMIAQQMQQLPPEAAAAAARVSTLITGIIGSYFDVVKGMAIPVTVGGLVLFIASFVVPLIFKKEEEKKGEKAGRKK